MPEGKRRYQRSGSGRREPAGCLYGTGVRQTHDDGEHEDDEEQPQQRDEQYALQKNPPSRGASGVACRAGRARRSHSGRRLRDGELEDEHACHLFDVAGSSASRLSHRATRPHQGPPHGVQGSTLTVREKNRDVPSPARQPCGGAVSQALHAYLVRSSRMSSSRAGPSLLRIGRRRMIAGDRLGLPSMGSCPVSGRVNLRRSSGHLSGSTPSQTREAGTPHKHASEGTNGKG